MFGYTECIGHTSGCRRPIMMSNVIRSRRPDAEPVKLMGSFMPFAGVRYYKLLTNVDAALGDAKIGSVGWRAEKSASEQTAPREAAPV